MLSQLSRDNLPRINEISEEAPDIQTISEGNKESENQQSLMGEWDQRSTIE